MIVMKNTSRFLCSLLILVLMFIPSANSWAQFGNAEPYYLTVRLQTVKADQIAAWESIRKERRDAEKAAGRPFSRVFQRLRGTARTYLIYNMDLERGSYDAPEINLSPTWIERLQNTLEVPAEVYTIEMYPELEANVDRWLSIERDMLYVRLRTTLPGRDQDYYEWQAEKLIPRLQDLGVTLRGGRMVLGGNIRTWVRFAVMDGWEELNEPLPGTVNDRNFMRMIAEGEAMVGSSIDLVYQYRDDLSFINE